MPRITLNQIRGIPDIISTDNYTFNIGAIPGGTTDNLMFLKCQQASYPGTGSEFFEAALAGFVVRFRGRKTFPRQLSITYVEDRTMDTHLQLEGWSEFIAGTISGSSSDYKSGYAVDGPVLTLYDTTGQPIKSATFYGLAINDKPDIQVDSTSTQMLIVQATFSYDFFIPSGITINDPSNS